MRTSRALIVVALIGAGAGIAASSSQTAQRSAASMVVYKSPT